MDLLSATISQITPKTSRETCTAKMLVSGDCNVVCPLGPVVLLTVSRVAPSTRFLLLLRSPVES